MGRYSIRELEKLSGIKAHTIRIWEKRHRIITPSRTSTNIRFYSDDDLKKIINVSVLNNSGLKISRIAEMSAEEINRKIVEISKVNNDHAIHVDQLVVSMIEMDEESFEKVLANIISRYGFEHTVTQIIYPFLEKIGILWQTQSITPAHEHFISNLIRQKIIVAIDGLPIPARDAKKIVLFLPEGEMHEMGLLFFHYLTRKWGFRTYYLGQSLPHADLVTICKVHRPEIMVTSITSVPHEPVDAYLEKLSIDFPEISIYASGAQVHRYAGLKIRNVQTLMFAFDLKKFII